MRVYIPRYFCESTNSFKGNFVNILARWGEVGRVKEKPIPVPNQIRV